MNGHQAKAIRHAIGCPRRPCDMSTAERGHYRAVKKRYNRLPGGRARQAFIEGLALVHASVSAAAAGGRRLV